MKKKQVSHPHSKNPENLDLNGLIEDLAGHGRTQREIASSLGISPGQLSRVKKGERPATSKHVRALREILMAEKKEYSLRERRNAVKFDPIKIDQSLLRSLTPNLAIEAFRDLLWARAMELGVPATIVNASSEIYIPDGGVDVSISGDSLAKFQVDDLLSIGRRFQIKTGNFEPWQPAIIKRELFGKKTEKFDNLGAAIQRTLREDKEYILVCFGVDLVDEKLRKAKENLSAAFRKCGYPKVKVDVWGQNQLIGLFRQYPSLCLRLYGHDFQGFRFWTSWDADSDMRPVIHYSPEQIQLLEDLRESLQTGRISHLRLLGEPGVGKTRMALELTRIPNLASVALYIRDGRALLKSTFLNELIHDHTYRFVLLIVDECPSKDSTEIWNVLKTSSDRVRLITIDHGPSTSQDEKMKVVTLEPVNRDQIALILEEYGISQNEANRWADFCQGCPRVAHVIGDNLRQERSILQSPAIVDVWNRFIVGQDNPDSEEVHLRRIVLRCTSLFEKFGYESPVEEEAKFIALMAESCDARLTWPRFQEIVIKLKQRRIIQGVTTLYITPRLLHVYLCHEFWRLHGSGFDIAAALKSMPNQMRHWFIAMLRFTDELPAAQASIDRLLGRQGIIPDGPLPDDQDVGQMLLALAEASPKLTLKCLRRVIGNMGIPELLKIRDARHYLVWTLERLVIWEDCFFESADLLLKLAEAENSTYANNATRTFVQLFSLVPGLATTQASASLRNSYLKEILDTDLESRRLIALAAAKTALSTRFGSRVIGPEYQGLRKKIEFWCPSTYGELWDAYREVWEMLIEKLTVWKGKDRENLIQILVESASTTLRIPPLSSSVLETLESLANNPEVNLKELAQFISRELKVFKKEMKQEIVVRLEIISKKMEGIDFRSKLRRYVKFATWDDNFDDSRQRSYILDEKLEELALEGIESPDKLSAELGWLISETSNHAFFLAFRLASHDRDRNLLPHLLKEQEVLGENGANSFLSGYLASVFEHNPHEWEMLMLRLAEKPYLQGRFASLVISSGMSDAVAKKVIILCQSGHLDKQRLREWWLQDKLRRISESVFIDLVNLQMVDDRSDLWSNVVHMIYAYYIDTKTYHKLPEELVFGVLTSSAMLGEEKDNGISFYWAQLAIAFIDQYIERTWDFFHAILLLGTKNWNVLSDLDMHEEQILARIFKNEPDRAWRCIQDVFEQCDGMSSLGIQQWLRNDSRRLPGDDRPGLIQFVSADKIFDWVDSNADKHGRILIDFLPKTLDHTPSGRLTRNFIAKYGKNELLVPSLRAHFYSRSWCGSTSGHYRKLREQARSWLIGEKNSTVIRWIDNYVDVLSRDLGNAEIEEERSNF